MRKLTLVVGTCLLAAGCGAPVGDPSEEPISLEAGKEDTLGNRHMDQFAGVLHFDDQGHDAALPRGGYKLAYTFRARKGKAFKLWSRLDGGDRPSTTLKLYGPRASDGRYPYVASGHVLQENGRAGVIYTTLLNQKASKDGIYLVIESAGKAGQATVGLNCGNGDECELGCIVPLFYAPVCGEDGETYGNKPSAACFDVPVAHAGSCAPSCDNTRCEAGQHCELVQVECFTTPCYPQPTCVSDCAAPKKYDPSTGSCICVDTQACLQGWHWDAERCQCVSPCETVRCAAGTHCVAAGAVRCVADQAPCIKTGCSGQICADQDLITTCEWLPKYACYKDATCERQADGTCGFTDTPALESCLESNL